MYCTRSNYLPLRKNAVVQRSLDLRLRGAQAKTNFKICFFYLVILSILFLDIWQLHYSCNRTYWRFQAECIICTIIALNALACFGKYLWLTCGGHQVIGTENQKCLLDGKNENNFGTVLVRPLMKAKCYKMCNDINDDMPIVQWHSSFINCRRKKNDCLMSLKKDWRKSPCKSPYEEVFRDDFITDIRKLPALIRRAKWERSMSDDSEKLYIPSQLHWNFKKYAASKKNTTYDFTPLPEKNFGGCDSEFADPIAPNKLLQCVANLRFWISTTILQRLVNEIEYVDEVFRQCGLNDLKIGAIGQKRLRLIAENQEFVKSHVPMFPMLLAFLDGFSNQEYLVQRIKELSKGTYIKDYRWNSGRASYGQEWQGNLPTDAAIVFHLFCVYLDSQLMPLPQGAGQRPFYSRYVIIRDEKPVKDIVPCVKNKANCAILATDSQQPNPKFNLISKLKLQDCVYDTNNLFYVIIQFLTYMQKEQGSVLESVNLGKSGINIMGVIENYFQME
ncbi:transmembrane protein 209-like isoform X1 [Drosophila gunungcola]|nr:transmembrane protein 209-like isoform X1 [Drosophila gunungcola]